MDAPKDPATLVARFVPHGEFFVGESAERLPQRFAALRVA